MTRTATRIEANFAAVMNGNPEVRMGGLFKMDYRRCGVVGRSVCVRRSEGQCREENGCVQDDCPLSSDFAEAPVARATPEFDSRIGMGWLAGRLNG
jgi:hypothetical protein